MAGERLGEEKSGGEGNTSLNSGERRIGSLNSGGRGDSGGG